MALANTLAKEGANTEHTVDEPMASLADIPSSLLQAWDTAYTVRSYLIQSQHAASFRAAPEDSVGDENSTLS